MSGFAGWGRWVLFAALASAASLPIPYSAAQNAADSSATYPVRGVVLNSLTHEPIARALVEESRAAALTDSNGRFELALPAGDAMLTVRRPGFVPASSPVTTLQVGENTPDLTLTLAPLSAIVGHVSVSTGEDADNIRVTAYRHVYQRGRSGWQVQGNAQTNSEGIFRFTGLQAPAAEVLMTLPVLENPPGESASSTAYGYAPVFYPDGAQTSASGLLAVAPGQQASVELGVTRQPFYPVTIRVKGLADGMGASIQVHDESGLAEQFPSEFNMQKRTAQLNLPVGHYYAELVSYGAEHQLYGRIDFAVKGIPVEGMSVTLLPLNPVLVRIQKNFTAASTPAQPGTNGEQLSFTVVTPANSQSDAKVRDPGVNLTLNSVNGLGGQYGGLVPVAGSSDPGLFQIQGVIPGSYFVSAMGNDAYVSSVTCGGVDLAKEPLTIGPGGTTQPIDVTLRNDAGQIRGTVRRPAAQEGAQPAGGTPNGIVFVFAIPLFPTSSFVLVSGAQLGGDFTLGHLAPGSYSVVALDAPVDITSLAPELLARYISKGQSVSVDANGTATVSLDVISPIEGGQE